MIKSVLEVVVCSIEDAVEAKLGGADRLEVVGHREIGGLTPSPDLVRRIKTDTSLPLRVMVRESAGFETSGYVEIERLCASIRTFNEIGVDGIVFGFLKGNEPDFELIRTILAQAPEIKATFHHAFEDARDKLSLIEEMKAFPQVDRLLSHGGNGTWTEKTGRLGQYQDVAFPEITVIAGGGLDLSAVSMIKTNTSISEFHVGNAARVDGRVSRACVAELANLVH
jgi:copper homeostasis protein